MKLNVLERIALMQILPEKANFINFKILNELRATLSFNEQEIKDMGIEQKDNQITWTNSKEAEIEIGDTARSIICTQLKKLDNDNEIDAQTASLYEKFIMK